MKRVLLYVPLYREISIARESWIRQKAPDVWIDLFIMRYNPFPGENVYKNLEVKNELARRICIESEYDYLFIVEDDIILPDNALELLIKTNVKIISGLYRLRPETAFNNVLSARIYDPEGPQDSDDRYLEIEDIKYWGEIIECWFTCCGCMLIRKDFLIELKGFMKQDVDICQQAKNLYIPIYCHTGVLCGHVDKDGNTIGVKTHGKISPYRSYDLSP